MSIFISDLQIYFFYLHYITMFFFETLIFSMEEKYISGFVGHQNQD